MDIGTGIAIAGGAVAFARIAEALCKVWVSGNEGFYKAASEIAKTGSQTSRNAPDAVSGRQLRG